MPFPVKTCVICSQKFELKPDKPGFANRCPECSAPEAADTTADRYSVPGGNKVASEMNEARRRAIRNLLYREDS